MLDPFGGAGATLIACAKAGRQARLVELDPKYVDVILRRFQALSGTPAVREDDGRAFEDIVSGEGAVRHRCQ